VNPNLTPTAILDFENPAIRVLVETSQAADARQTLQRAHRAIRDKVQPVYSVDEWQPASVTLLRGSGSCSQRLALLETVARASGVPTRVRALWVRAAFWFPRFAAWKVFIPRRVLLLWPQFHLDGGWLDFDELYGALDAASNAGKGFTNTGETLFEAVADTAVDFFGKTCEAGCPSEADLSRFIERDAGFFDSRDDALRSLGSFQNTLRGRLFELLFGGRKSA